MLTESHPHDDHQTIGQIIRSFVQMIVLVCCLFLLVRTIVIEPFGVTTGSMAFTLHGNNRQCDCPRCGYHVVVGSPTREDRLNPQQDAYCPNCGYSPIHLTDFPDEVPGYRLLVDKITYQARPPRRWEMTVFHCPVDDHKPYVKRVIGLPNERVFIKEGDIYINDELQRKPLELIREMKIPILDMNRVPETIGWVSRWQIETHENGQKSKPLDRVENVVRGSELLLDASSLGEKSLAITYRNRNLDTGTIEPIRDRIGFNGGVSLGKLASVHDFILECDVVVPSGEGVFSCRLIDGADAITADIPIDSNPKSGRTGQLSRDESTTVAFVGQMTADSRIHKLEFAFVDRTAHLTIDGKTVAELQIPAVAERKAVEQPLRIGVRGARVGVRNLVLSRDVHYRSEGKHAVSTPYQLGEGEYFVLGDNSPNSKDSREWDPPGVPVGRFIGKPFFIHQPLTVNGVNVNGREHRVRGLDWDRMRLSW